MIPTGPTPEPSPNSQESDKTRLTQSSEGSFDGAFESSLPPTGTAPTPSS